MKYDEIFNEVRVNGELSGNGAVQLYQALVQVYPMIFLANLTCNTYVMLSDSGTIYRKPNPSGIYDLLVESGQKYIHPTYKQTYLDAFERQSLLRRYARGASSVSAKLYQKNANGDNCWVYVKTIRLMDESGDIVLLYLLRYLEE